MPNNIYSSAVLPASSKSIRVLDLAPSQWFDDPLIGHLRVISLDYMQDNYPVFNALSYVWGSWSPPEDILRCGDNELPIMKNCRDALRQFRHLYGEITIWVDSICIDQNNAIEKEQQLLLMKEIYTWAEVVYIWLGVESREISSAMDCLSEAADTSHLPLERVRLGRDSRRRTKMAIFTLKLLPPLVILRLLRIFWKRQNISHRENIEQDLTNFFGQEWFTRVWTFQEAILASHSIILSGSKTLRWDTLVKGMECLKSIFDGRPIGYIGDRPVVHYGNLQDQVATLSDDISTEDPILPQAFWAFDRVIHLWMRIDRPKLGIAAQDELYIPPTQSVYSHQRIYANIHSYLVPEGFCGGLYLLISFYILVIVIHGIPLLALYVYANSGDDDAGFKTSFSMVVGIYFVLGAFCVGIIGGSAILDLCLKGHLLDDGGNETKTVAGNLMEGIVHTLRQRKATVSHDKSFGLHGVLESLGLRFAKLKYDNSQGQTYHELLLDLLHWSPAAVVLLLDAGAAGQREYDDEMQGAPSWVPNWNRIPPIPAISGQFFLDASHRNMDATLGSRPKFKLGSSSRQLLVRGHWKGHIRYCTARFQKIDRSSLETDGINILATPDGPLATFRRWIDAVRSNVNPYNPVMSYRPDEIDYDPTAEPSEQDLDPVPSDRVISERVWDKSWLDRLNIYLLSTQQTSTYEEHSALRKLKALCKVLSFDYTVTPVDIWRAAGIVCRMEDLEEDVLLRIAARELMERDVLDSFVDVVNDLAANDRRFFITSDGSLGCGSKNVTVGDRLALVAGVAAPLVLRSEDPEISDWFASEYTNVCSAFILGWMDGSVFEHRNLGAITLV
ncbi:heterokaryon incompatibility protein-domain-containing protein [Hypoxylon fuscum]|nr:heterokaryon incompatibility protein-domain-containing protein [Hypoxylon fuscum]